MVKLILKLSPESTTPQPTGPPIKKKVHCKTISESTNSSSPTTSIDSIGWQTDADTILDNVEILLLLTIPKFECVLMDILQLIPLMSKYKEQIDSLIDLIINDDRFFYFTDICNGQNIFHVALTKVQPDYEGIVDSLLEYKLTIYQYIRQIEMTESQFEINEHGCSIQVLENMIVKPSLIPSIFTIYTIAKFDRTDRLLLLNESRIRSGTGPTDFSSFTITEFDTDVCRMLFEEGKEIIDEALPYLRTDVLDEKKTNDKSLENGKHFNHHKKEYPPFLEKKDCKISSSGLKIAEILPSTPPNARCNKFSKNTYSSTKIDTNWKPTDTKKTTYYMNNDKKTVKHSRNINPGDHTTNDIKSIRSIASQDASAYFTRRKTAFSKKKPSNAITFPISKKTNAQGKNNLSVIQNGERTKTNCILYQNVQYNCQHRYAPQQVGYNTCRHKSQQLAFWIPYVLHGFDHYLIKTTVDYLLQYGFVTVEDLLCAYQAGKLTKEFFSWVNFNDFNYDKLMKGLEHERCN